MYQFIQSLDLTTTLEPIPEVLNGHAIELFNYFRNAPDVDTSSIVKWLCELSDLHISDVNSAATLTKIRRIHRHDGGKRGLLKDKYRHSTFELVLNPSIAIKPDPGVSQDSSLSCELQTTTAELVVTKVKLQERRVRVGQLTEETKQLKRKVTTRERQVSSLKEARDVAIKNVRVKVPKLSDTKCSLPKVDTSTDLNSEMEIDSLKRSLDAVETRFNALQEGYTTVLNENDKLRKELREAEQSIDYQHSVISDDSELCLFDEQTKTFNSNTVECVMNLTSFKVATRQVGNVIKEVARLCGKSPNVMPSRSTCDNIVDRKVPVCHKQLGTILPSKSSTTLYTDETRKYDMTDEVFAVSDEDQNTYILGLREMYSKSSSSVLDTLKSVLADIHLHCVKIEAESDPEINTGYRILAHIKNTMSDRASTEKSFHQLLQQYRKDILPHVIDSWSDISDDQKELCGSMNNFYCGLHLLVAMADVTDAAIKQFENTYLEGKNVGSGTRPELKMFHKSSESGALRLMRTCSKGFAMGGDEKSGAYPQWKTYLQSKGGKNSIVRFKHNRFNMIFLLGQEIYFHHEDLQEFLDRVHGTPNSLLKAILLDIKEPLYLAGAKCLGMIAKYVSSPLWRLIEQPGHILDMNHHYEVLLNFLEESSKDSSQFILGDHHPFEGVADDSVLTKLLQENEAIDKICAPLLQCVSLALHGLIKRMAGDHLPCGKFYAPSPDTRKETKSAKSHNKLPEFIFGQLDNLLRYRPNASTLANESLIMYTHNKTRQWLETLPAEEKAELIDDSRKEGRAYRQKFKSRLTEIHAKRLEIQREKQRERERLEKERIRKAEVMTNDVCFYGLWQTSSVVDEGLSRLDSENEKRKALKVQLDFRKNVLKQKHADRKVFNLSAKPPGGTKYVKLSIENLRANLIKLVEDAFTGQNVESKRDDAPLLVGKTIDHVFADGMTYRGHVISVVPGFPSWYNTNYDNDEAVYAYNLLQDYENGDLTIVV